MYSEVKFNIPIFTIKFKKQRYKSSLQQIKTHVFLDYWSFMDHVFAIQFADYFKHSLQDMQNYIYILWQIMPLFSTLFKVVIIIIMIIK